MGRLTSDPNDPELTHGADTQPVEQASVYLILSDEERAKGFVRPVRRSYWHSKCGVVTTMSLPIAQTYARDPKFYGGTYCVGCRMHLPVGENGDFYWVRERSVAELEAPVSNSLQDYHEWMISAPKVGT